MHAHEVRGRGGAHTSAAGFSFHSSSQPGAGRAAPASAAHALDSMLDQHAPVQPAVRPRGSGVLSAWAPTELAPAGSDGATQSNGAGGAFGGAGCAYGEEAYEEEDEWGDSAAFENAPEPPLSLQQQQQQQHVARQPAHGGSNGAVLRGTPAQASPGGADGHEEPSPVCGSGGSLTQPFVRSLFQKPPPRSQRAKPASPEPSGAELAKQKALDEALTKVMNK